MKIVISALAITALFASANAIARGEPGYHSYSYTPRTYTPRSVSPPAYTPKTYSSSPYSGEHYTSGYTRQNGTAVQGYHATNPNETKADNWSTRGNVNPYTGQPGTKNPY